MLHLIKINRTYLFTTFLAIMYVEVLLSALIFLYDKNSLVASDKFLHFFIFSLISFILYFLFSFQTSFPFLSKHKASLAIIIAVIIGVVVEITQIFIPTRTVNIYDAIANFLGSLITVLIIKYSPRSIKKMRRTSEKKMDVPEY